MVNILDIQDIQYLNLFSKITGVNSKYCFNYNNMLVFLVPIKFISKALGPNSSNLRKMSDLIRRRIRVVAEPTENSHIKKFVEAIVSPINFKDLQINNDEIVLNAGSKDSKAMLIGRNKIRLSEMQKIIKNLFEKDFRIM